MNRFAPRKYLLLLISLMAALLVIPFLEGLRGERLIFDVLVTVVFLAAFRVIFADVRLKGVAFLLGVPTLVGLWTGYMLPDVPPRFVEALFHVLAAVFFGVGIAALLRAVQREKDVSSDALFAALSGYILLGMLFGHMYSMVDNLQQPAFNGMNAAGGNEGNRHMILTYYSFITLTTVGYGDVTPACAAARSLAITEAITGQFYLAVLVAELIGKRMSLQRGSETMKEIRP
jgi:hypothetical protein